MANDVLGYYDCTDCGERGTVHRTKRGKARLFYKRCGCGCDQRSGSDVQTKLYDGTQWIGDKPEPPPNYKPKVQKTTEQPKVEPKTEPKPQPKEEPKTTAKTPILWGLAGVVGLSLLTVIRGG